MAVNIPSGPNDLRNQLVDTLVSKNMDMRMRRVVDAAPAQDKNDYVILDQLNSAVVSINQSIADISKKLNNIATTEPSIANQVIYQGAISQMTLTTTPQNVPGVSIVINKAGRWLIHAVATFVQSGNENTAVFVGLINVDNGASIIQALVFNTSNVATETVGGATVSNQIVYVSDAASHTITLQAYKTTGAGASYTATQTNLSLLWVSP